MLRVCKAAVKAKGGDVKSKTRSDWVQGFVHSLMTSVFMHSFDAFIENLQCHHYLNPRHEHNNAALHQFDPMDLFIHKATKTKAVNI